jgi:hypothetical protein
MSGLAGFDLHALIQKAIASDEPLNLAADYGVSIIRARSIAAWRCILAYHLTPEQSRGRQYIYIECLDETGERTREPVVNWTPSLDHPMKSAPLDGRDDGAAGSIAIRRYDTISVRINDGTPNIDSDSVGNIHARHGTGADYGDHSFLLVFQRQGVMLEQPTVEPVVKTPALLTLEQRLAELERWRNELDGDGR